MNRDYEWRRRTVRRHRIVFRVSALLVAAGLAFCVLGAIYATSRHDLSMLGLGMLLVGLAGLNAYRIVIATVKILELDLHDGLTTL